MSDNIDRTLSSWDKLNYGATRTLEFQSRGDWPMDVEDIQGPGVTADLKRCLRDIVRPALLRFDRTELDQYEVRILPQANFAKDVKAIAPNRGRPTPGAGGSNNGPKLAG
ncbi:hypothetical protein [Caulobacter rhizosphaerae]|uniref:hypothetical protein n=1 Tax=Caulobacter rhizosphaerae TaxID=2010972 RepID=UPI0013D7A886|nr:hypothetical protein [Caulobacter rhizosphaerae]GGL29247.1 hypothetical protein GCM10010983_28160 [Caulobacter rhizosphaerae]